MEAMPRDHVHQLLTDPDCELCRILVAELENHLDVHDLTSAAAVDDLTPRQVWIVHTCYRENCVIESVWTTEQAAKDAAGYATSVERVEVDTPYTYD